MLPLNSLEQQLHDNVSNVTTYALIVVYYNASINFLSMIKLGQQFPEMAII